MPIYKRAGAIPKKRHTVFRQPNGELYHEELFGTEGFSSTSSLLYHLNPPTMVKSIGEAVDFRPKIAVEDNLKCLSFKGFDVKPISDYLQSRKVFFVNDDMQIGIARPTQSMEDYFFKNSDSDEMLFIHEGSGVLHTMYGQVLFEYGDYVVIPRGTVYRLSFNGSNNRLLFIESHSPIRSPKRYRNEFGQYLEHSPFCERDYRYPESFETIDQKGDFLIRIKKRGLVYPYVYGNHPFDLIGWDGYNYPYAFSIFDFAPITGRIHMPPPIHQQFEGRNFVVCSFVPRMYDYHPDAIPAPYHHSNIDSEEILYYVDGDFMSRNHVEKGFLSLHPGGIPHGPHPGAYERSIGQKETLELAVMVDTFKPLQLTQEAVDWSLEIMYNPG